MDASTKREHTIPEALAGRIISQTISSSEFNNLCANPFDQGLIDAYKPVMEALSPMLAVRHKPGRMPVENPVEPGKYAVENGNLVLIQPKILAYDIKTRRPSSFSGDPDDVSRMKEQLGQSGKQVTETWERPAETATFCRTSYAISPEIEVAALKSALLTFDQKLQGHALRFTRSAKLNLVREFVRSTVETKKLSPVDQEQFSLGIQYKKLASIKRYRAELPQQKSKFEHVLIASGNVATRSLDIVWLIAGVDPFGFRVCHDWDGADFTCTIINEMLRDGQVHGPFFRAMPTSICEPTEYRSFQKGKRSDGQVRQTVKEIAAHRWYACRQADLLVESTCDDYVIANLVDAALKEPSFNHALESAVHDRLKRLFTAALEDLLRQQTFERIFQHHITMLPEVMRRSIVHTETDRQRIDWEVWLKTYRDIHSELQREIGISNVMPADGITVEKVSDT